MLLNIYVMPLMPYLAGRFEPALSPSGDEQQTRPPASGNHDQAHERVMAIQDSLTHTLGKEVRWTDEGSVVFSGNIEGRMLHALRSLAAWHEYPHQTQFVMLEDPRDHPSLKQIYRGEQTGFPHLMRHSDNRGFWFPVDYPEPAKCDEASWWLIGSCQALGRELDRIARLIEALPPGADRECLEEAHAFFNGAVSKSIEHTLPVIIEAG